MSLSSRTLSCVNKILLSFRIFLAWSVIFVLMLHCVISFRGTFTMICNLLLTSCTELEVKVNETSRELLVLTFSLIERCSHRDTMPERTVLKHSRKPDPTLRYNMTKSSLCGRDTSDVADDKEPWRLFLDETDILN